MSFPMNPRILELAKQSGLWFVTEREDLLQDFAELIVQQCIIKIEEAAEYSPELYGVALDIQDHFGVE